MFHTHLALGGARVNNYKLGVCAGFRAGRPTVWIAEGLLNYFTQDQNDALLQHMHKVSFLACCVP